MPGSFELPLDIERKLYEQIDFALVLTYTRGAQVAQEAVRLSLPKSFTIRNNFVSNGIRVEAATKRNPQAAVFGRTEGPFSIDFMVLQETGGTKSPTRSKHLAIPVNVKRTRSKKAANNGIIRKEDRPSALLASKSYNSSRKRQNRVFKIDESTPANKRHDLPIGIYAAHPRQKRRKKGQGLTMLYSLIPSGQVDDRFKFVQTATKAAQEAMPKIFEEALAEAIRTAR